MRGPPWIADSGSSRWLRRWPICVNTTSKTPASSYVGRWTPPPEWDEFWLNVAVTDLRFCTLDGRTAIPFDDANLNIAGRSGYVILNYTVDTADVMEVLWVYWSVNTGTPSNTSSTIADATNISFYTDIGGPLGPYVPMQQRLGETLGLRVQRQAAAKVALFYQLPGGQIVRNGIAGRAGYEGLKGWSITTDLTLTAPLTDSRVLLDAQGRAFIKVLVSGGSSGDEDKAVHVLATSTTGAIYRGSASVNTLNLT